MYTFPQKKIARTKLNADIKAHELKVLDSKIKSLQDHLHALLDKRTGVELAMHAYKRLAERLQTKYERLEGSNVKQPLKAKFAVKSMPAKKGWLSVQYEPED